MQRLKLALALILLCLPAISPFLQKGMPLTDDGNLHLYRAVALDHSLRNDGTLYPRFSSALVYGYGAPLFNYFPPSSYYPTVVFHAFGLNWVDAWKATMIFYVLLAGFGAYWLGKETAGEAAGYLTAAAYVYAPYALFDTVSRGTSSEYAALAFIPFAVWGFIRLAKNGNRWNFLLATLSFAIFILMHTLMTLFGTALLLLICGALWLQNSEKLRVFWQMALAGILALLMTAFFWWPALVETDFVKIDGVVANLDFIDVTRSLRDIGEVFALPKTADPSQLQAIVPIVFAWPALLLALFALRRDWLVFTLMLFFGLIVFLQLPASAFLWQQIPLLSYSQFAWRTMSMASLALALLSGIGAAQILNRMESRWLKSGLFCVFLVLHIFYGLPWLYRPSSSLQADSIADAQAFESRTGSLTLSSYSEYLPVWTLTPPPSEFSGRLQANPAIEILAEQWTGTSATLSLNASSPTRLVLNWLYFPGWEASLNGQALEVFPNGDSGLLAVEIPAGQSELRLAYGSTANQRYATIMSFSALVSLIAAFIFWTKPNTMQGNRENHQYGFLVIGSAIAIFLIKTLVIDPIDSPFKNERFRDGQLAELAIPLNANFNGEIMLLGSYVVNSVKTGETAEIRLFWTATAATVSDDYSSLVTLRDSQGNIVAEGGSFYPANLATSNWQQGYYLEEILHFFIPPYTPPGDYTLYISLYQSQSGQLLELRNAENNPIGVDTLISPIRITRPNNFPAYLNGLNRDLAGLRLLEIVSMPLSAQVGDELIFSWLWEDLGHESTEIEIVWGEEAALSLDLGEYWQSGDIWRNFQRIYIPASLRAGNYELTARTNGQSISLGQMQITEPERDFEMPVLEEPLESDWQNGIRLLGYETLENGLVLYWQPHEFIPESLRLFVQLQAEDGQIIAVNDGIPVEWTRPTSGWYPQEIIRTEHRFENLPETYRLLIGWYRPNSGERILLEDGGDVLSLEFPD